MSQQRSWKDTAVNAREFELWDRSTRRSLGFMAGLELFRKNNTDGFQIASRHWPHKLCWDWTIGWHPHRKGIDGDRRLSLRWSRQYRFGELALWCGVIRLSWQNYGYMVQSRWRDKAPKIIWQREMDEAVLQRSQIELVN